MMSTCIFCRTDTADEPEEHIVPEGLVGDRRFNVDGGEGGTLRLVLTDDEVCGGCNRRLGRLDHELIKQTAPLRVFWNPVGTKKGKPARTDRPGFHAMRLEDGPEIVLNMENHPITTEDGISVPPSEDQHNAVESDWEWVDREAGIVRCNFHVPLRWNKRFVRGLHKVAFELLALQKGVDYVLRSDFDILRRYVREGRGQRKVAIFLKGRDGGEVTRGPKFELQRFPGTSFWFCTMMLGISYAVDLSPNNEIIEDHEASLKEHGLKILEK